MRGGLICDLFAGGGGASVGIEAALQRPVDIAINHDAVALAVHKANHPDTRHLEADIWEVRPEDATGGRPVELLWASPDCTHFSIAKGGQPRQQNIRSLAWVVTRWAKAVRPRVICLENVREFQGWGPLDAEGHPIRVKKGATFRRWQNRLASYGYTVDYRILDASEYGAPTRRRRLFLVARWDGVPIQWPEPTHGDGGLFGLKPYRTAAECIDWSLPCPSIFERKKPLADKTLWRIAQGIRRFVLDSAEPFIIVGTQKHALVAAFLTKHFGGVVGVPFDGRPLDTITGTDHHALTAATLVKLRGDNHGADLREPMPTISAQGNHLAEVRAFLVSYFGSEADIGQSVTDPLRTITTRDRFGLVMVHGQPYQIADIGMRMLEPHELLRAQFGRFAEGYDLSAATTKKDKVRLIGNSVAPECAEAVVSVNRPDQQRQRSAA